MGDRSSAGAKLAIGIDTDVLLIVRGILTKGKQTTLYSTYRRMVGRTIYTMHSAMSSYRVLIDNLVCARTHNRELSHPCVTDVYTFNYVVCQLYAKRTARGDLSLHTQRRNSCFRAPRRARTATLRLSLPTRYFYVSPRGLDVPRLDTRPVLSVVSARFPTCNDTDHA